MEKKLLGWEDFKSHKINEISRDLVNRAADELSRRGHSKRSDSMMGYISPGGVSSSEFTFLIDNVPVPASFLDADIWMFTDNWVDGGNTGPAPLAFRFRDKDGREIHSFWIVISEDGYYEVDGSYDDEEYPDGRKILFATRKDALNFCRFVKSPVFIDYLNREFGKMNDKRVEQASNIKEVIIDTLSNLRVNDFYR